MWYSARKDTPTSYHLCDPRDDSAAGGDALVTRGEDLKQATHLHRLLQALMELADAGLRASSIADRRFRTAACQAYGSGHVNVAGIAREAGVTAAELRERLLTDAATLGHSRPSIKRVRR